MKLLLKIGNYLFYVLVSFTLIAAIGSAVMKRPILMTAIRSNSMYPLFQKGDMVLLNPFFSKYKIRPGDIIIFKTEGGSYDTKGWIAHRVIDGNSTNGFITKGDANDFADQLRDNPSIKSEWIVGSLAVIGGKPLKVPLIGQLPLFVENYSKSPYTLPAFALIIGLIIGLSELFRKEKKKIKRKSLDMQLIYFFSGITISILMFSTMLAASENLKINYEVSELNNGSISGSSIGILKLGDKIEKPLSELNNKGFFPTVAVIICNDNQISFSNKELFLTRGMQFNTTMTVNALKPGRYNSTIRIGMFFPFLPQSLIYSMAKKSYWLALTIVSLIPGLPFMLYPLIDSTLRRKTIKFLRHKFRRIKMRLSLIFH